MSICMQPAADFNDALKVIPEIQRAVEKLYGVALNIDNIELPTAKHKKPILFLDRAPSQAVLNLKITEIRIKKTFTGYFNVTKTAKLPGIKCTLVWSEEWEQADSADQAIAWLSLIAEQVENSVISKDELDYLQEQAGQQGDSP